MGDAQLSPLEQLASKQDDILIEVAVKHRHVSRFICPQDLAAAHHLLAHLGVFQRRSARLAANRAGGGSFVEQGSASVTEPYASSGSALVTSLVRDGQA
jgi:hypothetical protein